MVSVIVPVYNVEEYLPACIESIRNQTLSDLEIILVDDGSTDRSGTICDEFAKKDSRIVVIHKENGGLVSARKAGLKVASGSYIGYVDSDDWIEASMYEDMLALCERENADIAVSRFYSEDKWSSSINVHPVPEGVYRAEDGSNKKLIGNLFCSEDYSTYGFSPNFWSKLFRKDLLYRFQFAVDQRITYGEDAACTYPCLAYARRVVVTDQSYYHYFIRKGSISRSADERYFERISVLYQHLKVCFSSHPDSEVLMKQLKHYMLCLALNGFSQNGGFGFDIDLPAYFPPIDLLRDTNVKKLILYGAGAVGQSYYQVFRLTKAVEVVGWIDRQWEKYREMNLPTQSISCLGELEYDGILIAVKKVETVAAIRNDLLKHGVPEEKIFHAPPQWLFAPL